MPAIRARMTRAKIREGVFIFHLAD